MATERHEMAFVVGAVLGSVAGAVYGLLNAPQAGWRTRADLSGYAEEWGDRLAARVLGIVAEARALTGLGDDELADPAPAQFEFDVALRPEPTAVPVTDTGLAQPQGVTTS